MNNQSFLINDIFIKDLPYEFLKNKSVEYLSSQEIADHISLFDSLKSENTPSLIQEDSLTNTKFIDFLKYIVQNKYLHLDFNFHSDNDKLAWIYISSQVILNNKYKYKELPKFKQITNTTNNLTSNESIIRRKLLQYGFTKFKALDDISNMKLPLSEPEIVNNPLINLVERSRYYQSSLMNEVFDTKVFSKIQLNLLVNNISKNILDPNVNYLNSINNTPILNTNLKYNDLLSTVQSIRDLVIKRYLYATTNSSTSNSFLDNDKLLLQNMRYSLSKKLYSTNFIIDYIDSSDIKNIHSFNLPITSDNILILILPLNTTVNDLNYTYIKNGSSLTITLSYDCPIRITYFYYEDLSSITYNNLISNKYLYKHELSFNNIRSFKVISDDIDEGYIFIGKTIRNEITEVTSINKLNDYTYQFNVNKDITNGIIIPILKNNINATEVLVNSNNIYHILSKYDFMNKKYESINE